MAAPSAEAGAPAPALEGCRAEGEACDGAALLQLDAAREGRAMRSDDAGPTAGVAVEDARAESGAGQADPPGAAGLQLEQALGPLVGLLGTWEGGRGLNVVALPHFKNISADSPPDQITAGFALQVQNYTERLRVWPLLGLVPQRGYGDADQLMPKRQEDQFVGGVLYELTVWQLLPNGSRAEVIHVENGQWFFNAVPGVDRGWAVAHHALNPAAGAVVALGHNRTLRGASELREDIRSELHPYQTLPHTGGRPEPGYLDPYFNHTGTPVVEPVRRLLEVLADDAGAVDVAAVKLRVATAHGGGLLLRPGVRVQARNRDFVSSVWIETWTDTHGKVVRQQLQYAQVVQMLFMAQFNQRCRSAEPDRNCLISWPHAQVNTLLKVADYHGEGHPRALGSLG